MNTENKKCCRKCSVNRPRDIIERCFEIDCAFCSCHNAPTRNTEKESPVKEDVKSLRDYTKGIGKMGYDRGYLVRDTEWKDAVKEIAAIYITSSSVRNALADLLDKMK